MRDWRSNTDHDNRASSASAGTPGKRTLTESMTPIQRRAAHGDGDAPGEGARDEEASHGAEAHDDPATIAAAGTEGPGGPMPHLDRIQRAFGRHDVGGIRAHVGGRAANASAALGAEAYAHGDAVAFRDQPSLHTAAHEAAHVVQQRAGVSVPGGMGQDGDRHEQHADAVADRVVQGESAESLLDQVAGGTGGAAVQARTIGAAFGQSHTARFVQRRPQLAAAIQRRGSAAVQRTSAGGVSVSNMKFTPREIKDDGATTTNATVQYSNRAMGGPASLNWSITSAPFGATIDASGKITPGTDTVPITDDKVVLTIKAVDSVQAGAFTTGKVTMWGRKFLQAKADLPVFRAGTYKQLNYTAGLNGKFDAVYSPSAKRLGIEVRVAFNFVDDLAGAAAWNNATKRTFKSKFVSQVQRVWSGQWQFRNAVEPQLIWNKLNPISVKVTTKEDTAAPHFTATIHKKDVTQNVTRPVADLKASAQTVDRNPFPGTGAAELAALQAKIPSPVAFAPGSAVVAAPAPLQFVGTYLHSVKRPKFLLTATGHAPVDPAAVTPAQKRTAAAAALTLSRQRVNAVRDLIRAAGIGVHQLNVVAKGDVGAAAAPAWDKVDIAAAIDPSYVNEYPRLAHEFGHMLGLGDEYPGGARVVGPGAAGEATHHGLSKDALGQDMADSFARITTDAEGIMQGGSDVRPVHYVTLWSALGDAAATATAPVPAFQRKDWKFVGF